MSSHFLSILLVLSLANYVLSEEVLVKETDKLEFRKNEKTTGTDKSKDQIDCLNKVEEDGTSLCDYTPDLITCYNYQKSSSLDDFSCYAKLGKSVAFDSTKIECAHPGKETPDFSLYVKGSCYIEIVLSKKSDEQTWLDEHSTLISVIIIVVIVLGILAAFYNQCIRKRC